MPPFTTRGTLTEEISEKIFRKERRRLQAKHLWMEVKLRWHVLDDRMYTGAPTGSHVSNSMHCFSTRLSGVAKRIPMRKKHIVDLDLQRSSHGGSNAKSGCYTSKVKARHWFWTFKAFYRLSGARKQMLVLR